MKNATWVKFILIGLLSFIWTACGNNAEHSTEKKSAEPEKIVVVVNADRFTQSQGKVEKKSNSESATFVTSEGQGNWLAYEVEIPQAGRYVVNLYAVTKDTIANAWIEDYFDNTDGRTYNITGTIAIDRNNTNDHSFLPHTKKGSPLNAGKHAIKLHLNGSVDVEKIEFTLIKPHVATPKTLTQKMDGLELFIAWSDEFDGTGLPDTSKWTFDYGDWGWGNNELQYYTENRTKNARLENGNLVIEAHKNDDGMTWSSARLTTRGKVAFLYGRIEFRAKVPKQRGNWAAGWTLGDDYVDELSWPYCGEIDILESVGYEMDDVTGDGKAHASAHCGAYYFKLGNQPTGITDVKNMNEDFHTYAVDWNPDGIIAYVDNVEYFRYEDTSTPLSWPFDKPQNIILNLAMGGGWGGLEGMDPAVTSQKMIIDYVRVYEKL
jgi:hypothetical protein